MFVQGNTANYEYFTDYNVSAKIHNSIFSIFKSPLQVIWLSFKLFPLLFPILIGSILILFKVKRYHSSRLFLIVSSWTILVLGILSASNYSAPRYLILLIVPIALVIPLIVEYLLSKSTSESGKSLILLILMISIYLSIFKMGVYLSNPNFSFVSMAERIENHIQQQNHSSNVVMGHFADSLALAANIKPLNDRMGFRSLEYRLENLKPNYYISIGEADGKRVENIKKYYDLNLLERFDIYENYDYGKQVWFYQLNPLK